MTPKDEHHIQHVIPHTNSVGMHSLCHSRCHHVFKGCPSQACHSRNMRQPIPDPPNGVRFCRKCNCFLSLSDFPSGKRRHECKVRDAAAADPFLSPPHMPQQLDSSCMVLCLQHPPFDLTSLLVHSIHPQNAHRSTCEHRPAQLN